MFTFSDKKWPMTQPKPKSRTPFEEKRDRQVAAMADISKQKMPKRARVEMFDDILKKLADRGAPQGGVLSGV